MFRSQLTTYLNWIWNGKYFSVKHFMWIFISSTIELVIGGVMLIVGIASASLTCRPLCCATTTSGQQSLVHYTPNQAELAAINLPPLPNLPTSLLSSTQVLFVIWDTLSKWCTPSCRLWCSHLPPRPTRRLLELAANIISSDWEFTLCCGWKFLSNLPIMRSCVKDIVLSIHPIVNKFESYSPSSGVVTKLGLQSHRQFQLLLSLD